MKLPHQKSAVLGLALSILAVTNAAASWSTISMPNLSASFGAYNVDHLPDGRFVYGSTNSLYKQDTFGSAGYTSYANLGSWDPSFVAVHSDTIAAVGAGGFGGPSAVSSFDPSNTATTVFTAGVSLANYSANFYDASHLLVGGQNGAGGLHSINYTSLDGTTNKVIIDSISTFSGAFTMDISGNLYVSDNDDLKLYRFTPAQVSGAIAGSALAITDGTLITTLNKNGSIAVDDFGRIWSAGWQSNGVDVYDPSSGQSGTHTPLNDNTHYVVSSFSDGSSQYIGLLNAAGFSSGDAITYAYEKTNALSIPEPSSLLLFCSAFSLFGLRRRVDNR